MRCPECGARLTADLASCPGCGRDFEGCESCDLAFTDGRLACSGCGAILFNPNADYRQAFSIPLGPEDVPVGWEDTPEMDPASSPGGGSSSSQLSMGGAFEDLATSSVASCGRRQEVSRIPLRILSWNIERLGGTAQWGLQTHREIEIQEAIAEVIFFADPDICAIIEVMHYRGLMALRDILQRLNSYTADKQWDLWVAASEGDRTGATAGNQDSGETYAVLYKLGIGIAPYSSRFAKVVDPEGSSLEDFPCGTYRTLDKDSGAEVETSYRAPAEFVFRMSGIFAGEDESGEEGEPWFLPLIVYHAPGPQDNEERQRIINQAVSDLGMVESAFDVERYPDCVICADLNSAPDASNVLRGKDEHFDTNEYYQHGLDLVREWRESLVTSPRTPKEARKRFTRWKTRVAEHLAEIEVQRLEEYIDQLGLRGVQANRRKKVVREWRRSMEAIVDRARTVEETDIDKYFDLLGELDETFTIRNIDELSGQEDSLELTIEDIAALLEYLGRPKGFEKGRVASIKRDFTQELRTDRAVAKMEGREDAWDILDGKGFFDHLTYDENLLTTRRRSVAALRSSGKNGRFSLPKSEVDLRYSNYDQVLTRAWDRLDGPEVAVLPILFAVLSPEERERVFVQDVFETDEDEVDSEGNLADFVVEDSPGSGMDRSQRDYQPIDEAGSSLDSSPAQAPPAKRFRRTLLDEDEISSRDEEEEEEAEESPQEVAEESPLEDFDPDAITGLVARLTARFRDSDYANKKTNKVLAKHGFIEANEDGTGYTLVGDEDETRNFGLIHKCLLISRMLSDHDPLLLGVWVRVGGDPKPRPGARTGIGSGGGMGLAPPPPVGFATITEVLAQNGLGRLHATGDGTCMFHSLVKLFALHNVQTVNVGPNLSAGLNALPEVNGGSIGVANLDGHGLRRLLGKMIAALEPAHPLRAQLDATFATCTSAGGGNIDHRLTAGGVAVNTLALYAQHLQDTSTDTYSYTVTLEAAAELFLLDISVVNWFGGVAQGGIGQLNSTEHYVSQTAVQCSLALLNLVPTHGDAHYEPIVQDDGTAVPNPVAATGAFRNNVYLCRRDYAWLL